MRHQENYSGKCVRLTGWHEAGMRPAQCMCSQEYPQDGGDCDKAVEGGCTSDAGLSVNTASLIR